MNWRLLILLVLFITIGLVVANVFNGRMGFAAVNMLSAGTTLLALIKARKEVK